jgi:hypothetical protein
VPINVLLQRGYAISFKSNRCKDDGRRRRLATVLCKRLCMCAWMHNSCDLLSRVLQVDVNRACPAVRVSPRVSMHRSAHSRIAAAIFSGDNGFVTKRVNDHNEHGMLLQINTCRRTAESQ